jgi:5-methylcytosine-specific restriction endonuclease McrA
MMYQYICLECGVGFESPDKRRKFCSMECAKRYHTHVPYKKCVVCGKDFRSYDPNGKCCSIKCRGIWYSKYCAEHSSAEGRICPVCHKTFVIERFKAKRCCSYSCASKERNDRLFASDRITRTCQICGKEFSFPPSGLVYGDPMFCSKPCKGIAQRGVNHHNWQGGKSRHGYPDNFSSRLKRLIKKRDSKTCQLCGTKGVSVHHIDYDKNNLAWNNLILLCRSCHGKTSNTRNRSGWQVILSDKVSVLPYAGFGGY